MNPPSQANDEQLARALADTEPPDATPDPERLARARRWVACLEAARPGPSPEEEQVLALIGGEFQLRRELGKPVDPDEYAAQFPELAGPIRRLADPDSLSGLPARYRVGRLLGQGGMGRVYAAHDAGLDRPVAVKVLSHTGPLLADLMHRERTLLAALRHPHIVTVYDSGELADARPFFVMEFVEGDTLDRYAAARPDAREVARLVRDVAVAVGAAHALGIVHRDLKPQNVKVTPAGEVRVLDFGLARRVDADAPAGGADGDPGAATGVLGTRAYMSPEQAAGKRADARADVYALGVTLAQLLPPRAPRDLLAVADKCRAADPAGRYPDATALAAELTAWLGGQPVAARAGRLYRMRKFARRNWVALTAAGLACAALAAGVAADAVRVRRERDRTEAKRVEAVKNYRLAKRAVQEYLTEITSDPELMGEGRPDRKARLLEKARVFYEEFVAEAGDDPELRAEQADALVRLAEIASLLGEVAKARELAGRAAAAFEELVRAHPDRTDWRIGLAAARLEAGGADATAWRVEESERWYRLALDGLNGLDAVEARRLVGKAHNWLGWNRQTTRRSAEAAEHYEITLAIYRRLAAETGSRIDRYHAAGVLIRLGTVRLSLGERDRAMAHLTERLGLMEALAREYPRDPRYTLAVATTRERLAKALTYAKSYDLAEAHEKVALDLFDRLVRDYPAVGDYRRSAANNRMVYGYSLWQGKRFAEAEPLLARAKAEFDALAAAYPEVLRWARDRAVAHQYLGQFYASTRRPAEAVPLLESAAAGFERVEAVEPRMAKVRSGLSATWSALATLRAAVGDAAGAAAAREKYAAVKARIEADKDKPPAPDTDDPP